MRVCLFFDTKLLYLAAFEQAEFQMGHKADREAYCHFGAHCWVLKKCLPLRSPRVDVGIGGLG